MKKKMSYTLFANIVRLLIIFVMIFKIVVKDYTHLEIVLLTLFLTFYDRVIENVFKIKLSNILKYMLLTFMFLAQMLGTVFHFYQVFSFWDIFLHTLSGVLAYFIGLDILKSYSKRLPSKTICFLFAICFSLSTGVVWEIFEFLADTFLGKDTQLTMGKTGQEAIQDTMFDLISLFIGTFLSFSFHALRGNSLEKQKEI